MSELKVDGTLVKHDGDTLMPLYSKYKVERLKDEAGKHKDCSYFVIDWTHDKFAVAAMTAYADACESQYPDLAKSIRGKLADRITAEHTPWPYLPRKRVP